MIEAYAVADVRAAEAAAMAGLPEGELMARAAQGLAAVVAARLEERQGMRVVGLVGSGNNGGDALYALADLAERGFAAAAVHVETAHAGGLAAALEAGVALLRADPEADGAERRALLAEADVVVDGLLGIGGRPGLSDEAAAWVDEIPEDAWVVAVDLPSGADPAGEVVLGRRRVRRRDGHLRRRQTGPPPACDGAGRGTADRDRHRPRSGPPGRFPASNPRKYRLFSGPDG